MRVYLCVCLVLMVAPGALIRGAQAPAGPRILIADQMGRRLVLIDRTSGTVLAENRGLARTDCVARWASGEFLVCEGPYLSRVNAALTLVGRIGTRAQRISAVSPGSNGTLLISDPILHVIEEIDPNRDAARVWFVGVHYPQRSIRLDTGNTLVADGTGLLKEFDSSGNVVRSYGLKGWAAAVRRLPGGETLVGESNGYELFDASGQRIWSREWKGRVTCLQTLEAGEILLCDPDARRVVIVDRQGEVAWESGNTGFAWDAIYIPGD